MQFHQIVLSFHWIIIDFNDYYIYYNYSNTIEQIHKSSFSEMNISYDESNMCELYFNDKLSTYESYSGNESDSNDNSYSSDVSVKNIRDSMIVDEHPCQPILSDVIEENNILHQPNHTHEVSVQNRMIIEEIDEYPYQTNPLPDSCENILESIC